MPSFRFFSDGKIRAHTKPLPDIDFLALCIDLCTDDFDRIAAQQKAHGKVRTSDDFDDGARCASGGRRVACPLVLSFSLRRGPTVSL